MGNRTAWKALNDDALRHRFDAVLVFKLDRAFRSVKHLHDTLCGTRRVFKSSRRL
nr:recombinase family protein [Sulfobacillus sp. hq2]